MSDRLLRKHCTQSIQLLYIFNNVVILLLKFIILWIIRVTVISMKGLLLKIDTVMLFVKSQQRLKATFAETAICARHYIKQQVKLAS